MLQVLTFAILLAGAAPAAGPVGGRPWPRHTIDDTSHGADGVKIIDVNTDGRPDIATGWEQGGHIRVYFNPSRVDSRSPWRQVTVGRVASPEDAVFADLDGDLSFDVVSACEGNQRSLFVHWAPKDHDRYWDAEAWSTMPIEASKNGTMWMFAQPMQVDGKFGPDLVAGGKGPGAEIGWMEAPANPRDPVGWRWHPLRPVGWIMSIYTIDMDGDGDLDILFSDRKGERRGVYWLENPGRERAGRGPWVEHRVGSADSQAAGDVMFIDVADADGDGLPDVAAAVKPHGIQIHRRLSRNGREWRTESRLVAEGASGTAKSVRLTDLDGDGSNDILYSAEGTPKGSSGVIWISARDGTLHDVSGPEGIKYDFLELIDLDGDQDLDVVTTEEQGGRNGSGLGLVWYENPGPPR